MSSDRAHTVFQSQNRPLEQLRRYLGKNGRAKRISSHPKENILLDEVDFQSLADCTTASVPHLRSTPCDGDVWTHCINRRLLILGISFGIPAVVSDTSVAQTGVSQSTSRVVAVL